MSLNVFQQVFALSLASNLVHDLKGTQDTLQKELQHRLSVTLPKIDPEWIVVWGPVVWKHDPNNADTGPDNSWYIALHPRLRFEDGAIHPTYVIAIAGTPRESLFVWYFENFAVDTVSDFNAWVAGGIQNPPVVIPSKDIKPGGAYIATGTVNTTHLLLTTKPPEGAAFPSKTLLEFVAEASKSKLARFITTGHSLGGALSPSLALALVRSNTIHTDNTLTYPTAGASPGNVEFTALSQETLPPRKLDGAPSYQGWNLNLVNTLDIVPQAWASFSYVSQQQNLFNIPTIYGKPTLLSVLAFVLVAVAWSRSSGAVYKPLLSQYFSGPLPPTTPNSLKEFISIASNQHVALYIEEVGIPIPVLERPAILNDGITQKTEEEILYNYPVLLDLEWALEHPQKVHEIEEGIEKNPESIPYFGDVE